MTVATGLDRVAHEATSQVRKRRVALLSHPASVDRKIRPALDVLTSAGAQVTVLLGPEHGVDGEAQDMEGVSVQASSVDRRVYSLYGETEASLKPSREMLEGVEMLVVDLQDIGTRYYTFVWTAALCLETCSSIGLPMLVLDRPNPIDCTTIEGPQVGEGFNSFVGLHDVSTRHGLTIGELLTLYARDRGLESSLEVITMLGYRRDQWFDQTGLPWVLPSPNMPSTATALVYPGMCLFEGTNVSEGRGTTRPFEIIGAPWVDGELLARILRDEDLPGCFFRPMRFKPMFHKFQGKLCGGVQTHVTDRQTFRPLRTGVALLASIWKLDEGRHCRWRAEPYEFVEDRLAIDLLAGGAWLRGGIEAETSIEDLWKDWFVQEEAYRTRREHILLYK